jgi:hypothetical protein
MYEKIKMLGFKNFNIVVIIVRTTEDAQINLSSNGSNNEAWW